MNQLLGAREQSEAELLSASSISSIPLKLIDPNPDQPRKDFDAESLEELAESIRQIGLIQPITVQPLEGGRYLLVSGERRYRAAQTLGLESLPAYIRDDHRGEVQELALIENIQREDLNAIEIALAYQSIAKAQKLTQEALATRVGKKRATVANYMRLLNLPAEIQLGISQRLLEMGHARALLQVTDPERQLELYQMTISEHLSVREVEDIARAIEGQSREEHGEAQAEIKEPKAKPKTSEEYKALEEHLGLVLGSKVTFKRTASGKGRITIPFSGEEDLLRIMELLERIQK